MDLPQNFQFNQGNLQDFVDCRRRFYLRHIHRLAWPAVPVEPVIENERRQAQGAAFHRLLQQHLLGIPAERLEPLAAEADLQRWWRNYLDEIPSSLFNAGQRFVELSLSASLGNANIVAKYDLLLIQPDGKVVIFDWKTSQRRSPRRWLEQRMQTRIYPYLLARAGAYLNQGAPIQPGQIEMHYWFAEFPDQPEQIDYSDARFNADSRYLEELAATIQRLEEADFILTANERQCRFCVYRSLCERGVVAGSLPEMLSGEDSDDDSPAGFDLDFTDVAEVEY